MRERLYILMTETEITMYRETQEEALEAVKTLAGWGLKYVTIQVKDGRWYIFKA